MENYLKKEMNNAGTSQFSGASCLLSKSRRVARPYLSFVKIALIARHGISTLLVIKTLIAYVTEPIVKRHAYPHYSMLIGTTNATSHDVTFAIHQTSVALTQITFLCQTSTYQKSAI